MNNELSGKLPTLHDVAERAGVSHITVSRVVNGKSNVSAETRRRVTEAMEALGYVPNPAAQALQSRRARMIELISTDLWGVRPGAVMNMTYASLEQNYQFSIMPTSKESLYAALEAIPNRLAAGTILHSQEIEIDYRRVAELTRGVPFVHMGGRLHSHLRSVAIDHFYGGQIATQHLIDLGHTQIAHITGYQTLIDGKLRFQAWQRTLVENGLPPGPVAFGNFAEHTGKEAMQTLLDGDQPFTAVFIASDAMAVGAIDLLTERGIRVPDDISIVGFDNHQMVQYMRPRLTTVTNDMEQLATLAIEYLLQQVSAQEWDDHQRILTPRLIVRESTRALRLK